MGFESIEFFLPQILNTTILPQRNSLVSRQTLRDEKCWMKRQQKATVSYSAYQMQTSFCAKTNFSRFTVFIMGNLLKIRVLKRQMVLRYENIKKNYKKLLKKI